MGPGTPLFRLVDPEKVAVAITLGASSYGEVALGAEVALRLQEEGPVVWRGPIVRRSASVDLQERTFRIYAEVPTGEATAPLPPGSFVIAEVPSRVHRDSLRRPPGCAPRRAAFRGLRVRHRTRLGVVDERVPTIRALLSDVALLEGGVEPGELVGDHQPRADERRAPGFGSSAKRPVVTGNGR